MALIAAIGAAPCAATEPNPPPIVKMMPGMEWWMDAACDIVMERTLAGPDQAGDGARDDEGGEEGDEQQR